MGGTGMAMPRWAREPEFYARRIVRGDVLDIGPGGEPLSRYATQFPEARSWTCLDHRMQDERYDAEWIEGDACEAMLWMGDRTFDLIYSSHSLEHVTDASLALARWWERVRSGGHLVLILPSWEHYERIIWPPSKNTDHRHAWVMHLPVRDPLPWMRGLINEAATLGGTILRATTLDAGFVPGPEDQTANSTCESALEIVVRKP